MADYSFSFFRSPVHAEWRRVRPLDSDAAAVREALALIEDEAARDPPASSWIEVGRVGAGGTYLKLGSWRWVRGAAVWLSQKPVFT